MSGDSYEWHHRPGAERRAAWAAEAGFGVFVAVKVVVPGCGWTHWPLKVKQADPRILISDLLMDMIRDGHGLGWEIDGDLLRFTAVNGTWVYRIGEHLEDRRAWVAEWPD